MINGTACQFTDVIHQENTNWNPIGTACHIAQLCCLQGRRLAMNEPSIDGDLAELVHRVKRCQLTLTRHTKLAIIKSNREVAVGTTVADIPTIPCMLLYISAVIKQEALLQPIPRSKQRSEGDATPLRR